MSVFVIDASATLPWCFADERTDWSKRLRIRLEMGDQAIAPAHWQVEVANVLVMAVRRKRLLPDDAELFLDMLALLTIFIEPPLTRAQTKAITALCEKHTLTFYDAAYLELAQRRTCPLATLDRELIAAAQRESVELIA